MNVLKLLAHHLDTYITSTPPPEQEQRVKERVEERVPTIDGPATMQEIQRVSDALPKMIANGLTFKRVMHTK
jgi:hypothetical protein